MVGAATAPADDAELLAAWTGWRKAMAAADADIYNAAACKAYREHSATLADTIALTPAGAVIKLAALVHEATDFDGLDEPDHYGRRLMASLGASAANLPDLADALRFAVTETLKDMEFKHDLSRRWWKTRGDLAEWKNIERIFDETGASARREAICAENQAEPREADGMTKAGRRFLEAVSDLPDNDQEVICDCMALCVLVEKIEDAMAALGKRSDFANGLMRRIGESFLEAAGAGTEV